MKNTSILLFLTGLAVLFGLSWLFPVPDVSPVRIEDESNDRTKQEPGTTASFTAGGFVFPYYRDPMDAEPTWILRGSKGDVIRGKNDRIIVQNPRIKHFPPAKKNQSESGPSTRNINTVTITGKEGRKKTGNVAFVKENVRVRTDQGGTLTTRQLYADFENDRLYTRSDHEVKVDRSGLFMKGIGFSGNSRLSQFTLRNNVYLRLSATRIRSLSGNQTERATTEKQQRYYITASGPLHVHLVRETNKKRTWKISFSQDVFLYRFLDSGSLRQSSDQLHLTLVERKIDSQNDESTKTSKQKNRSNFQISSLEALGQVHIDDPGIEIWSNRVKMNRTETKDIFHLKGDTQKIGFKETPFETSNKRSSPAFFPDRKTSTTTYIRVAGTGRLERPRPLPGSDKHQPGSNGRAEFEGQIYVRRHDTRLQSNALSIAFSERSPDNGSNETKSSGRSGSPMQIRLLDARKNVLFLNNDLASTGDQLTWVPPARTVDIRSGGTSVITNIQNRIHAREISIDRSLASLTAEHDVRTTVRTGTNQGFQLFTRKHQTGSEQKQNNDSNMSPDSGSAKWNLNADYLSFRLQPESSRLRSLNATGNVEITSEKIEGYGDTFKINRPESRAVLKGTDQKAKLHQNRHRAFADSFRFQLDRRNVILKGQKRLRIVPEADQFNDSNDQSSNSTHHRNGPFQITSGAPFIIHRSKGRIRVLGPARVQKPGGLLRGRRVNVTFHPENSEIRTIRVNGDVFVIDRAGAARGDLMKWNARENRLMLRGQPYAMVNRDRRTARYEIITIWNNWKNLRGKRYKWRSPGTIEGEK